MSRGRARDLPLALLALLAFAPSAFAQDAQNPAPSAGAPAPSPLTPALRAKMVKLIAVHGVKSEVPAPFASPLGLTDAGMAWVNRQVGANDNPGKRVHSLAVSETQDQGIVLTVRSPEVLLLLRADRNGALVGAVSRTVQPDEGDVETLTAAEASADLAAECAFWDKNIDALIAAK
jgi:hypothetical protein